MRQIAKYWKETEVLGATAQKTTQTRMQSLQRSDNLAAVAETAHKSTRLTVTKLGPQTNNIDHHNS